MCWISIIAPCNNINCGNGTDTCVRGVCTCGKYVGLVCDDNTEFPYCLDGNCACTKSIGVFEAGDGTTRGSCESLSHKCYPDGRCRECMLSSECSSLSDTCINGKCRCGNNSPCNPAKSNICISGVCYCGTEENGCHTEDKYYPDQIDPKNPTVLGLQRSKNEVCEKISEFYNPSFIPDDERMSNGMNEDGTTKYEIEYDDDKGKYIGEYKCLGKIS